MKPERKFKRALAREADYGVYDFHHRAHKAHRERTETTKKKEFMNHKDRSLCGDKVGVIEVEIPDCLPIKPLMKKIETLIKEEETRWVLFERAVDDLDLTEEDLLALEEVREKVWREEKKSLGL